MQKFRRFLGTGVLSAAQLNNVQSLTLLIYDFDADYLGLDTHGDNGRFCVPLGCMRHFTPPSIAAERLQGFPTHSYIEDADSTDSATFDFPTTAAAIDRSRPCPRNYAAHSPRPNCSEYWTSSPQSW